MGEGLKETLQGFWRHFSLLAPASVITSDSKEEKQVEKNTTKVVERVEQFVEVDE